jgi:hypothetical protein
LHAKPSSHKPVAERGTPAFVGNLPCAGAGFHISLQFTRISHEGRPTVMAALQCFSTREKYTPCGLHNGERRGV